MDAREQVEAVETTYDGAIVFCIYENPFHFQSTPPGLFYAKG
jgi:hypothetical protein